MLRQTTLVLAALLLTCRGVWGDDSAALDWSTWRHLPVFDDGRLMPLDTFARTTVREICGRESPRLELTGALPGEDTESDRFAEARKLFPQGKPRKFEAAELLFSWLVEPEKWNRVPILRASNRQLRAEVLGVPLANRRGRRLKYVSPWQCENAAGLAPHWEGIRRRAGELGKKFEMVGVDKKVGQLTRSYERFRDLTFDPRPDGNSSKRFFSRLRMSLNAWQDLAKKLRNSGGLDGEGDVGELLKQTGTALQDLAVVAQGGSFSLEKTEPAAAAFRASAAALAERCAGGQNTTLASMSADLARHTTEAHLALYDNGSALRLVPALNPGALEKNRLPGDDAQPWLSLQTLLYGSENVLQGYPTEQIRKLRRAFDEARTAYLGDGPRRQQEFALAMDRFAAAVRTLGKGIEPLRKELPIRHRDEELIAATAYPPDGYTRLEVRYNRSNPFLWSWVVSLAAVVCFALSFGLVRKPMFWLGTAVLLIAQGFAVFGFALRTYVTGLVSITGMFETVAFAALVGALLGLWFALLPMTWPGIKTAWRLTAAPASWEATPLGPEQLALGKSRWWLATNTAVLIPRLYLIFWLFRLLVRMPAAQEGYFALLPRPEVGSSIPSLGAVMVWVVGWCVFLPILWWTPRAIPAALLSIITIPYTLARQGTAAPMEEVLARKPFALVGALVAFLVALVAYFAPVSVLPKDIGSPMPILRDNFWLALHVLTITASYGAGALAWGLGNISLAYYLFGRYRVAEEPASASAATKRRPPEVCSTLAGFIYKAIQVAVLMLAAGTVLGALWADVAWGRFWSWDAKEVWALISLLVYMVILHGRYAGWSGNFGLAVGSVLGATAILMAWYGVNFVLGSGLHSYATGDGGQMQVGFFVACNWLFVAAAAVRYRLETLSAEDRSPPLQSSPQPDSGMG